MVFQLLSAHRGAKSGSGAAGFIMAQTWAASNPESPNVWPRFSPDQHHNLHVSKLTVLRVQGL